MIVVDLAEANVVQLPASGCHRVHLCRIVSTADDGLGVNPRHGYVNLSFYICVIEQLRFIPLRGVTFMAKRRGNPNWGKPEPIGPITPTITEFEQVVREYKLSPDQYLRSTRLREWARRNKNSKYIPEPLLEAWGFEIESTL